MQITVTLDDELYEKAIELAEPEIDKEDIFREALKTFISVQALKRLAALGSCVPKMKHIPRDRFDNEE